MLKFNLGGLKALAMAKCIIAVFTALVALQKADACLQCPKTRWSCCSHCQRRMREEGLPDEYTLQSWFIGRINQFLLKCGKRLIGWDEILEGGLNPGTIVMSWRVRSSIPILLIQFSKKNPSKAPRKLPANHIWPAKAVLCPQSAAVRQAHRQKPGHISAPSLGRGEFRTRVLCLARSLHLPQAASKPLSCWF